MILTNTIAKWVVKAAAWITPGTVGVTIFPFIFIYPPQEKTPRLLKHEEKHRSQWKKYLIIGFPIVYIYQYLKYGYKSAPLEIEARKAENE